MHIIPATRLGGVNNVKSVTRDNKYVISCNKYYRCAVHVGEETWCSSSPHTHTHKLYFL